MSDYKPIPKEVLEEGEQSSRGEHSDFPDLAKTILYSAANVRGVFVCNREELKVMSAALEYRAVKPIIDKVLLFFVTRKSHC